MANLRDRFLREASQFSKYVEAELFNLSIHISLKHRYLYVDTPKAGCSTIKLTLQRLELEDEYFTREDFEDIHLRKFSPLLMPIQVGPLDAFLSRTDIFKFCFVRNPYTRILSCYLDKIAAPHPIKAQILRQLGRNYTDLHTAVSFAEFISAVEEQPISTMDPHWRLQYYQTFQESIKFDFIGRYENFSEDLQTVGEKLSPNFSKYFFHEQRNSTSSASKVSDFYTPELRERIYRIYELDFDYFGYSKEA
ncbi:MAG: sulfotransferase family protein [Cyanobacteria bacterium Co-bin8]|nr:sulfotransferase family protein [Cyanobacteria bacterium Co-bin8]